MYRSTAKRLRRASVWTATAFLAIGGGVAAAKFTSSPTTASAIVATTTPTATANAASLTTSTVVDRGVVVAMSPSSLTIRRQSGTIATYALRSSARVLSGHTRLSVASLRVGDSVIVVPSPSNPSTAATIGVLATTDGEQQAGSDA